MSCMPKDKLGLATIGCTAAAFVTLLTLLCWTASSSVFELKAQDDGDNRWWDLDFESEEYAVFNIALNMAFLVVSTLALAVPIARVWHPAKGSYDRYHLGALAAALFFTCNMLLVSFWYSIDIPALSEGIINGNGGGGEKRALKENGANNANKNNGGDNNMDESELLAYHRKVVWIVNLVLAVIFFALSLSVLVVASKLSEKPSSGGSNRAAHMEVIGDLWKFLSLATFVILSGLLTSACIVSRGKEAEYLRQDGHIFNLIAVHVCLIVAAIGIVVLGFLVLGDKKMGATLGVGMLSGGTKWFAWLLFMVFVLYINPRGQFPEDQNVEEGYGSATATAYACISLSLSQLGFSLLMDKYVGAAPGGASTGYVRA